MTNDSQLLQPAQFALNFISYAQDPVGGGWRYEPKQAGDTSVLGWQLMACKSGHMAYLKVPRRTILGASKFLDFVQDANGSQYGYTVPGGRARHHVGGPVVPHVSGLEARGTGAGGGGRVSASDRAERQHVLQLLCHAGASPLRRSVLG